MGATPARKQIRPVDYEPEDDDKLYSTRPPTSTRKYNVPIEHDSLDDPITNGAFIARRRARSGLGVPSNSGIASSAVTPPVTNNGRHAGRFPLMAVIAGMVGMAILAYGLSVFGAWWQVHTDDVTYGRPRTFQMDAVVGHMDSAANPTHFIFLNLNRHVVIIELPGGDASHAVIYTGPTLFGDGQDLTPITGEVRDVNGDGKLDLIVHIQDQRLVFINDGTKFRPLQPGEQVNLGP